MAGIDTLRGIAFQLAQTLSDVIDLVVSSDVDTVVIEGREDFVDYEILDSNGRRLAVRQAKTRQEPGTWGATELARILCEWGQLDDAGDAEFAFVTDASLNSSGQQLHDLIKSVQVNPDATVARREAAKIGRRGAQLPSVDVLQRVRILTRMGTTEQVLASLEMRILNLLQRSRPATPDDASNAANRLFRRLFVIGGDVDLAKRRISRPEVLAALGISEASLLGGLPWSDTVAASYRAVVAEASGQLRGFLPLDVVSVVSTPTVLRLLQQTDTPSPERPQSSDVVLDEAQAVLIGATGQGKTTTLMHLAAVAAQRGLLPILLQAAGHTPGSLPRRVRHAIEVKLGEPLAAGALDAVMATHDLVLFIDGVSEVDERTREALHGDLQQLAAQRPLRVIAASRDLPIAFAVASLPDPPAAFRLAVLDRQSRRQLAKTHAGLDNDVVDRIEARLGDTVDNPMLFLMALSVSADGVPDSRAEVYQQFLRGLATRARLSHSEPYAAALGAAWAQLIGRGLRTADHYTWLSSLSTALGEFLSLPVWAGQSSTPGDVLARAQAMGLLTRLDPDGGLAPLHDSFADYLAARAITRGEATLPTVLSLSYDETMLFTIEIAGLSDVLAYRLAAENPLLACRVSQLPQARGRADPHQVARLLDTFTEGCTLPLVTRPARLSLIHHDQFTGVVLADESPENVDEATFHTLIQNHPAVMVPPHTGSLAIAVHLWTAALRLAHRPHVRVFQAPPPADPELVTQLLPQYRRAVDTELHRLIATTLPATIRERVLATLGPRGIVARIDDPEPGPFGGLDLPVFYRRDTDYLALRAGDSRLDGSPLPAQTTAAWLMRRHPIEQAAHEINEVLMLLTERTWRQQ